MNLVHVILINIFSGTDNTVAMGCYGCIDVETAALTIIKGQ